MTRALELRGAGTCGFLLKPFGPPAIWPASDIWRDERRLGKGGRMMCLELPRFGGG
jgi:hypothetical protein